MTQRHIDQLRRILSALNDHHMQDGTLLWVSPGQTAIEALRNVIEDMEDMTHRTIDSSGKDELREREQVPQAGQWWFPDEATEPGDTATERAIFIVQRLNNNEWLILTSEIHHGVMDGDEFTGWHHEPRCAGWDWVVPEDKPQSEPEQWPKYYILAGKSFAGYTRFVRHDVDNRMWSVDRHGCEALARGWMENSATWNFQEEVKSGRIKQITEPEALALLDKPPQPAESPDDWVILDPAKYAGHVLRKNIDFTNTRTGWEPISIWGGDTIGGVMNDYKGERVLFRCRRRDLPPVTQQATVTYTGKGVPTSRVDEEPQPKRKTVRLWMRDDSRCIWQSGTRPMDRNGTWREIHVDPATGEFFVNEG